MKYEYGVEYETNGKKPDLPENTLLEVTYVCGTKTKEKLNKTTFDFRPMHDPRPVSFRIVDERYKPVEQKCTGRASVDGAKPDNAEPEKSWHEKGELPPVGTECEYKVITSGQVWVKCFFIGLNSKGNLVIEVFGKYSTYSTEQIEFRPLDWNRKADEERNNAVCAAFKSLTISNSDLAYKICQDLYDNGYLKNKAAS